MQRNIEVKIADDLCPSCSHPIEVFVPQPYASGPELLEVLEDMVARLPGDFNIHDWDALACRLNKARAAIAKAKGGANG